MLSPIIIFVYNRPIHTQKTIESLANNILAKESEVIIFSDAPKNQESENKVREVRSYINSIIDKKYFKNVKVINAQVNKGLAKSVIAGVSQIINEYGKCIVVEDDLISSIDFLQYMNEALDYYNDNKKIWSISGYNLPIKIPRDYKEDIYLSYRGCSWGYATWKDRWDLVDWNVSDYNSFAHNRKLRNRLNRGGRDMANMLDAQIKGKIDSWAIRWCYAQSTLDLLTVYPIKSRIQNIGLDGTGTHSELTSNYNTILNNNIDKCKFCYPELNKDILKNFKNYYLSSIDYLTQNLKNLIKRYLEME